MKLSFSSLIFLVGIGSAQGKTVVSCKDHVSFETEIHSVDYVEADLGVLKLIDFKPNSSTRVLVAEYGRGHTCLIEGEAEYRIPEDEGLQTGTN